MDTIVIILIAVALIGVAAYVVLHNKLSNKEPKGWSAGPIINGNSRSYDTVLEPGDLPAFTITTSQRSGVHYITKATGPLTGKKQIKMRYRVDIDPGVTLEPVTAVGSPTLLSLYFQRKGDDWSAEGAFETYRWYASFATVMPIEAGEHELVASLDSNWTAIQTSSRASKPQEFADALANAGRIGFVLGGGDGLGHGIFATGPAKFTVLSFDVE
jgi:hypothetical protein